MKNNKGYTLVELLVSMVVLMMVLTEVYIVMNNGSNVYNKGSYDVSLQTKAQQALMHLEDILIDANESVSYDSAGVIGDNGKLTIVNNPGDDYTVTFDNSDPVGKLYGYGKLMLTVTKDDGTVLPAVPLVDNVSTYRVITDEIDGKSGDSVFINLTMANKEYNYAEQTKEVYLRNRLGTRGSESVDDDTTPSANFTLNVLRHKTYPLNGDRYYFLIEGTDALGNPTTTKKYCSYFEWQSTDGLNSLNQMNDPGNKYEMTGNTTVKCNAGLDKKVGWGQAATAVIRGYEDAAARAAKPNEFITITLVTDKVGVGTPDLDKSAAYINLAHESTIPYSAMTKVYGISLEEADSVDYVLYSCPIQNIKGNQNPPANAEVIKASKGTGADVRHEGITKASGDNSTVKSIANDMLSSDSVLFAQGIAATSDLQIIPQNDSSIAGTNYSQIRSKFFVYMDGENNSFASYGKNQQTDNKLDTFDDNGYMFYIYCEVHYGGSGEELKFPAFFLFTGDADTENKILYKWANLDEQ